MSRIRPLSACRPPRRGAVPLLAAVLLLALPGLPSAPSAGDLAAQVSVAPRLGTLGLGVDLGVGLGRFVTVRGGAGFIPLEPSGDYDDVEYRVEIPGTVTLGVDLHPGGGGFRISGGVLIQTGDLALEGTPDGEVEIGDETFSPTEVGTLRGELASNDVAPFVTLGLGKHGTPGVGFFLDLGVAFLGDPAVDLTSSGTLAGNPVFRAELEKEEALVEDDLDSWGQFYPIVNLGVRIGIGR